MELPLPMGMGMDAEHVILELDPAGSAAHDGTLEVRAPAPAPPLRRRPSPCCRAPALLAAAPEARRRPAPTCRVRGAAQLGDELVSVDGVPLDEKTTIVDALDRSRQFHSVIARRVEEDRRARTEGSPTTTTAAERESVCACHAAPLLIGACRASCCCSSSSSRGAVG